MTIGTARYTVPSATKDITALRSALIEEAYKKAIRAASKTSKAHAPAQEIFHQQYAAAMGSFDRAYFLGTVRSGGTIVPAEFAPATPAYAAKVVAFKHLLHRIRNADISDEVRGKIEIERDGIHPATFWISGARDKAVPYVSLELTLRQPHAGAQGTYEAKLRTWTNDMLVKDICNIADDRKRPVMVARAKSAAFEAYKHLGMPGDFK